MPAARCPTCKRELTATSDAAPAPFCSRRCKLLDLSNWLDGRYVVSSDLPFDPQDPRVEERDDVIHGADE